MMQPSKSGVRQGWEPTEPVFRRLLGWLDEGTDSNGERYLEMRRRLVRYFDRKQCIPSDDLADETLNRVARRLEEVGTIAEASPAQYCYIVAKFVFMEHLRHTHQVHAVESHIISVGLPHDQAHDRPEVMQTLVECLEHCLEKLFSADRDLILEYYRGEQGEKIRRRRELAERLALTLNALSIRACRIRDRLEECVLKCAGEK